VTEGLLFGKIPLEDAFRPIKNPYLETTEVIKLPQL
jgi:hypothetical protein